MPHLVAGYTYEHLDDETFWPLIEGSRAAVFTGTSRVNPRRFYSDGERTALEPLYAKLENCYGLQLGIFYNDDFVGWHFGHQTEADTYSMTNTGLLAAHRRKGIYTALLPVILETLESVGFQVVTSRHTVTNNAVIIPKLKAGFVITGLELDDRFGTLVKLAYFFNAGRRKLLDVRAGQRTLDEETLELLS